MFPAMPRLSILILITVQASVASAQPTWSVDEPLPQGGRGNPYQLNDQDLEATVAAGRAHAVNYPSGVSETVYPLDVFFRGFDSAVFRAASGYDTPDDAYEWLGLPPFPRPEDKGVYAVPLPADVANRRLGAAYQERGGLAVLTYGCPACHAGSLFGKTVLGLSTRFPRANEFFLKVKSATSLVPASVWQATFDASSEETALFRGLGHALRAVETVKPQALGLDASIAQVSLSLTRRSPDADATRSAFYENFPQADALRDEAADSKPPVWWNVRYKNRWAADGSLVAGNPILTNLLWNELGRGTSMPGLQAFVEANPQVVRELTAAVFASEAPLFSDFFRVEEADVAAARRGQSLFNANCSRCHGTYAKTWDAAGSERLTPAERFRTLRVDFPQPTKVVDVGTDSARRSGMAVLAPKLNALRYSRLNGIEVRATNGYVPPPLVGIWARWPYFHNNAAPTLCDVLTRGDERPESYRAVPPDDPAIDFDGACNGYPRAPRDLGEDYVYDTSRPGLSNGGHDEGIFLRGGVELLSPAEKRDLIRFMQSL